MWCFRKFEAKTTKTWNCQISLWMRLTAREVSLAFQSAKVVYIYQTFVSRQFCCHWKFLTATNVYCKLRVWRVFNLSIVANRNFWWQQNSIFWKSLDHLDKFCTFICYIGFKTHLSRLGWNSVQIRKIWPNFWILEISQNFRETMDVSF